jgi:hypothetical protein
MSRPASLKSNASNVSATVGDDGGPRWMLAWLTALLVARWLLPTEAAAEGLTLWLTQLVLVTAVARVAWVWRIGERTFRFDIVDGAIALLIVAQVISALAVVLGVGNARAAINMAWEWIGSGVLLWMLRQELRTVSEVRSLFSGLLLTAGVLAGYGLWQHYVWYDQMTREYERLTSEYDRLMESRADERRLIALQAEMSRQGISLQPQARRLLEQRLKASREPFGLFALANTFAGLLAVMAVVGMGVVRLPPSGRSWTEWLLPLLVVGVVGDCLVLTKSRTAWVGLCCGLGWWGVRRFLLVRGLAFDRERARQQSGIILRIAAGMVLIGVAVAAAAVSGGLDRAVLAEAPKSLRYRLEYWQGTWGTIRDHFWLGTGPGNFRDHYLAHKLPASSEEIADPHNFVFDVWANTGVVGLLALLAWGAVMLRPRVRREMVPVSSESTIKSDAKSSTVDGGRIRMAQCGAGLAFPLAAIGNEFFGHGLDARLWWLGGIWWLLWLVTEGLSSRDSAPAANTGAAGEPNDAHGRLAMALEAAEVTLLVHLCGAGGIAMPAITQLLWLVWVAREACPNAWATAIPGQRSAPTPVVSLEKSASGISMGNVLRTFLETRGALVLACVLAMGCGWSATLPELKCRTLLQLGDSEWERQRFEVAQARYREAAEADPWSTEPLERLAESALQRAQQSQAATDFAAAIQYQQQLIERLPFASRTYRRWGHMWRQWFEQSRDPRHAQAAAEAFREAVGRYPHHAELLAEWAIACELAGFRDDARFAAARALRQDGINRAAGHSDKYLSEATRQRLQSLSNDGISSQDAN